MVEEKRPATSDLIRSDGCVVMIILDEKSALAAIDLGPMLQSMETQLPVADGRIWLDAHRQQAVAV